MSKILKIISIIWLLICISLAAIGISQSHGGNPDGGIAPAILITFLTAPLGIVVQLVLVGLENLLSSSNTTIKLTSEFVVYPLMIGLGYWQWFNLLPRVFKKMKYERSLKMWGLFFGVVMAILYGLYRFYIHAFPNSL